MISRWLRLAIFLPLGVSYSRGTALYALAAAPFLARNLTARGQWANSRALAKQIDVGPRLARQLADHLTWRRDDQLAALLSEILLDPALPLTREQRLVLRHRAQHWNPEPEQLKR